MNNSIILDFDGERLLRDVVLSEAEWDINGMVKTEFLRQDINVILRPYYAAISHDFKYIDFENMRDKCYFLLKFS